MSYQGVTPKSDRAFESSSQFAASHGAQKMLTEYAEVKGRQWEMLQVKGHIVFNR